MQIIFICLAVTCAITYIWDYTPFIGDIQSMIGRYLDQPVRFRKPLSCSLCMTTWVTLILLLIFNWKLSFLCLAFGWSTRHILTAYNTIDMVIDMVFKLLQKLIRLLNGNR